MDMIEVLKIYSRVWWSVGVVSTLWLQLAIFPSIKDTADGIRKEEGEGGSERERESKTKIKKWKAKKNYTNQETKMRRTYTCNESVR